MTYRIRNWNDLYENNRTRDLKRLDWVPIPNRMDGDGYTELLDHKNGAAHLAAWLVLVQIASRCDVRGTLLRDRGVAHDARSLARISRIAPEIFEEAIPRFIEIGWLEIITVREFKTLQDAPEIPQEGAGIPQATATIPQEGATIPHLPAASRARGRASLPFPSIPFEALPEKTGISLSKPLDLWVDRFYERHPKKRNKALVGTALLGALSKSDNPDALVEKIDAAHIAWCKTTDWNEQNARYAPKLDEWIADDGYTKWPGVGARDSPKTHEEIMGRPLRLYEPPKPLGEVK